MSFTFTTPFMGLEIPIVGVELGPAWAQDLNVALESIDSHTHAPGYGNLVPTAGLNINADLSFASYNATALRSTRYINQLAALSLGTDINCIYVVGGNLYYNNGVGSAIQLTLNGTINVSTIGSITGLGGTTGSASYSAIAGAFTFLSNTNTPAYMNVGPLIIGTNTVSPHTWTITPPAGLAASYTMTLPTSTPSSTSFLTMTSGGTLAPSVSLTAGITGSMMTNGTVTGTQIENSVVLGGSPTVSGSLTVDSSVTATGFELTSGQGIATSSAVINTPLIIVSGYISNTGAISNNNGILTAVYDFGFFELTWTAFPNTVSSIIATPNAISGSAYDATANIVNNVFTTSSCTIATRISSGTVLGIFVTIIGW
jgi:hypothetical protein